MHGDYCLPNVLFDGHGYHYLAVGEAGVGDRFIDIVAGIRSLRYNYGKGSVRNLLDGYGLQTLDRGSCLRTGSGGTLYGAHDYSGRGGERLWTWAWRTSHLL